jgi:hypothetical protein
MLLPLNQPLILGIFMLVIFFNSAAPSKKLDKQIMRFLAAALQELNLSNSVTSLKGFLGFKIGFAFA